MFSVGNNCIFTLEKKWEKIHNVFQNLLNTFQISTGKKYISHNTQKTGKS